MAVSLERGKPVFIRWESGSHGLAFAGRNMSAIGQELWGKLHELA